MPLPPLPTVGADVDNWGTELNTYLEALDEFIHPQPRWVSGYYYSPRGLYGGSGVNQALVTNQIRAVPIVVPRQVTVDRIGVNVTTAAGTIIRLMLYDDNGPGARPGTLLLDAGTVSSATTGFKEATISLSIGPGIIWAALLSDAGPGIECTWTNNVYAFGHEPVNRVFRYGWEKTLGGTTAPSPFPTDATVPGLDKCELIYLRAV